MRNLKTYRQTFQNDTFKPTSPACTLKDLLILHDSGISSIDHLEITGSLSYADLLLTYFITQY